jgi:hypothetical protein
MYLDALARLKEEMEKGESEASENDKNTSDKD